MTCSENSGVSIFTAALESLCESGIRSAPGYSASPASSGLGALRVFRLPQGVEMSTFLFLSLSSLPDEVRIVQPASPNNDAATNIKKKDLITNLQVWILCESTSL